MTVQAYSVDTVTGDVIDRIQVSDFPYARALSAGANGSCTIPLNHEYSDAAFANLIAHWKRTIVLERDGVVRFAGTVSGQPVYGASTVKLQLTDLWGLLARRGAWDLNAANVEDWSITYTDMSLETLVKRAVQRGTTGPAMPAAGIPLTLPADIPGTLTRTYYGYHLQLVADVLDDLALEGVRIDFEPRWLDGKLDHELRTNPTSTLHEWHVNAPAGGVTNFRRNADGAKMTNNSIFVGEGSEADMLVRSQADLTSDLPRLDRVDARKYITDPAQLAALAAEGSIVYGPATDAWSFDLVASEAVGVRLNDTARLWFAGDARIPDGSYDRRITRIEGSLGDTVTVTVQPTVASGGIDHFDARQELDRLERRMKALETASPLNHTSISYAPPGGGPIVRGGGILGIGIDVAEAIAESAWLALGDDRNPTTLYAIYDG